MVSWIRIFIHFIEGHFLQYSAGVNTWSAYFQRLFVGLFYFLEGVIVPSYAGNTTPYSANKTNHEKASQNVNTVGRVVSCV